MNSLTMKNINAKGICMACLTSFVVACNAKTEDTTASAADKDQIKKEIQAKEDEFAATYNSGQLKDIGYYADDATSFYQNRPPLVGKAAIVSFLKSDVDSNSNIITFKTNEVFPSSDGNLVVEIGYFTVVDSTKTTINSGNYMSLFEKRDGKYMSVRDMSASDNPLK
jgi:ketosteroid isomerase-like protein